MKPEGGYKGSFQINIKLLQLQKISEIFGAKKYFCLDFCPIFKMIFSNEIDLPLSKSALAL
jgi:hypothetical protein